ncbi:MAG: zinc-binding dehydrogenase [Planctomycetes bacterium]|nr:zinc-binding dehydrogenase [Planctomycetota bacterium]
MRAVEIPRPGPPEVLRLVERPDPPVGPGEKRIRVRAIGVNFADIMGRMGLYPDAPRGAYVPGYEVAGLDDDGRRVVAATRFGGYAEVVAVRPEQMAPLPDALSFEEGAAIPVNYLTAWVAIERMARLQKGERLLIKTAAGGVGLAAIQIARRHEVEMWGTVGSAEKAEFIRSWGVAHPVVRGRDPMPPDGSIDLILDPTGAAAIPGNLRTLSPGGRMVLYGASDFVTGRTRNLIGTAWKFLTRPKIDPYKLMYENRGLYGLNMLTWWRDPADLVTAMSALSTGIAQGWLRPHVGATFPLERAAEAHAYIQDRKNIGKVVLTVG